MHQYQSGPVYLLLVRFRLRFMGWRNVFLCIKLRRKCSVVQVSHSCPSLTVLWIDYCWFNYNPARTPIASRLSNSLVDINQIICCSLIVTPVSIEYRFVVTFRQLADSIYVAILSCCNQLHACRRTYGFQWNLPVINSTKPVTLDLCKTATLPYSYLLESHSFVVT